MVVIHHLDTDKVIIVSSVDQAPKKDKAGTQEAIDCKDAITIGRTIYEYSHQLKSFSERWGVRWKSILRDAWLTGGYPNSTPREDIPHLQRLRNIGGKL